MESPEQENEQTTITEKQSEDSDTMDESSEEEEEIKLNETDNLNDAKNVDERAKYIPLRLTDNERRLLRLVEAALQVSDYTSKVDIAKWNGKTRRITEQLKDICAIVSGLLVASDYKLGQELLVNKKFKDNASFFQDVFEVGRRHKIMNPEKMRTEYGKLVYLIQDAVSPEIVEIMEFNFKRPVRTVYGLLKSQGALGVLSDPLVGTATMEIIEAGKPRPQIQREIKAKENAVKILANKYQSDKISKKEIRLCLRSIGDNNSFLRSNCDSLDAMILLLKTLFDPEKPDGKFSLEIQSGVNGARLSHRHSKQYSYVLQSLTLWREILNDMFKLWYLSEEDLLDEANRYRLTNTGQGLNRVQGAPRVYRAITGVLQTTQHKVGSWVGSSVIHLGDHNVPNALMFIDKYTQVPRIINPIITCIQEIDRLVEDAGIKSYIDSCFGGKDDLKKTILCDFFRYGFDGSGADNFFDAGSCIDGRLTSAWNWCSKLNKKSFFYVFKLSGFIGFDGDFQK